VTKLVIDDLANAPAEQLEKLWRELENRHASRRADPELYDGITRCLDQAERTGRLAPSDAEAIRAEMASAHPAVVLSAHREELVEDRPALGAYLEWGRRA
jgi:hypothetical protein